jgi:hypothetical protein
VTEKRKRPVQRLSPGLAGGPERPSTVSGTKSASFPVVPSGPEAPYGRDENNKPIVPMRTDIEIVSDLLEKPSLAPGLCPHKNDPNDCIQCRPQGVKSSTLPNQSVVRQFELLHGPPTPEEAEAARIERDLAHAHKFFGLSKPIQRQTSSHPKTNLKFNCYRELLMIERDTIADLFDCIIEYRYRCPKVKPSEADIQRLQNEIAELDALILTRSAAWQKRHRPDDPLETNDRLRLKREETKLRDEKKTELVELRARLKQWQEIPPTPPTPVTFGEKYPITQRGFFLTDVDFLPDKLRTPAGQDPYYTEILGQVKTPVGDVYDINGYRKMLRLDGWTLSQQVEGGMTWRGWEEWENAVILQAITSGLIKPNVDLIKDYPGLGVYQPPFDPGEADETENELIIKTGGAEINGRIRGAGYYGKNNNRQRTLSDFSNTKGNTKGSSEPDPPFNDYPDDADDAESYTPN